MDKQSQRERPSQLVRWALPAFVAIVIFIVFFPVLDNGFVWDDVGNLLENPNYRGLGWGELRWMFTAFHLGHYQPLSWMTFGLDYLLWEMDPLGYHLTNLIVHTANGVLFYFIALRLLSLGFAPLRWARKDVALRTGAAFAALVFAVHPLRVESVAWLTERRDVLSGLFLLCAVLLYLRAAGVQDRGARWRWLGATLGVYALSLLSKASGITLPAVLLVLDVYPLRRLGGEEGKWFGKEAHQVWWEKVLFLLLAMPFGVAALLAQQEAGALKPLEEHGIAARLAQALFGIAFYLWKSVFPVRLSPLYDLSSRPDLWDWSLLLSGFVVLAASIGLFILRRRWPAGLASWVYYVVVLSPVLGIAQSGLQMVADRYTYLSCLGWAALAGAGVFYWCGLWINRQISRRVFVAAVGLAATLLFGYGVLTWRQAQLWYDSERLWGHAIAVSPESAAARYNLAVFLQNRGELEEAIRHYRKALEINPARSDVHYNLGNALALRGDSEEAIEHYRSALKINPNAADVQNNLGEILARRGDLEEAIRHYRKALQIDPAFGAVYNNLATALARQGELEEAIPLYRKAIEIHPASADLYFNLGTVLAQRGKLEGAIQQYREGLKVEPGDSEAHFGLGNILVRAGRLDEAIVHFRRALLLRPDFAEAHQSLGRALAGQGKKNEALQHYEEALRILKERSTNPAAVR